MNPKLRDQPRVLDNAPPSGYDEEFKTDGMKHFDLVSSLMILNLHKFHRYDLLSFMFPHLMRSCAEFGYYYD